MYSRTFIKAVADYILKDEDRAEVEKELRRYKAEFYREPDYNYYMYGNILPYYENIRKFMEEYGMNPCEDNGRMCTTFKIYVGKAIDFILNGGYDKLNK